MLEKAYDRVPREEIWRCMRERNVPGKYVKLIQDMYRGCQTKVRSAAGESSSFNVDVGLHQGSALSPYLFLILMDVLTEGVRKEVPESMMFADDIVLCGGREVDMTEYGWMCGVIRKDKIRNEHIRGTTGVAQASKKITERRLNWYGHVMRRNGEHILRKVLRADIPGKRKRG